MIVYRCDVCKTTADAEYMDENRTKPPFGWSKLVNPEGAFNLCPNCNPVRTDATASSEAAESSPEVLDHIRELRGE